ncbi:autotransporter outer membrane beta-barrel domain-containing protein [Litorivivens sp.]|uniref:autotransporter outer membrane beta-barrel domain-containing protein n=1 Tax=Litorivivens sp. TaxID=2020868 RepID=UPI00356386DD
MNNILIRHLTWVSVFAASSAQAANPQFQSFFDQACSNATGNMATRCSGPTGSNLSGDSESSLTPSQMLSAGDASLLTAESKALDSGELLKIGPLSVAFNISTGELDADDRDGSNAERGYTADISSFAMTFDYRHSEQLVSGAILSFERSELEFDALEPSGSPFTPQPRAGRYETDGIAITGFAQYTTSTGVFADASIGYTDLSHDFERNSVYQPSSRVSQLDVSTEADADGQRLSLHVRAGKSIQLGAWSVSPQTSVMHVNTTTDSYREKDTNNSGLAMRYKRYKQDSLLGIVGTSLQRAFSTDFGVISTQLRADYQREFERDDEEVDAIFVNDSGGTVFTLAGDDPDKSYVRAGLSVVALLAQGWSLYLDYEQLFGNSEYDQYRGTLGFRKEL